LALVSSEVSVYKLEEQIEERKATAMVAREGNFGIGALCPWAHVFGYYFKLYMKLLPVKIAKGIYSYITN